MRITKASLLALAGIGLLTACAETGSDSAGVEGLDSAGQAGCTATSRAENAAGMRATNAARAQVGLPAVRSNMLLAEVAAAHACDMARRGKMSHRGSTSAGPGPRVKAAGYAPTVTAENIAAGPWDLNGVLVQWNRSSGHLANIHIPQMRDFGVGGAYGADGKTRYWAAVYAAPKR